MFRGLFLKILIPIVLIGATVVIVALGRGYRFDFSEKGVKPTGVLVVNSDPNGAQIFIDGRFSGATNYNINLDPGWYEVTIKKEGYQDWKKKVRLQGEVIAKVDATLFLKNPSLSPLTVNGVSEPMLSPDGLQIAYTATPSADPKKQPGLTQAGFLSPILYVYDLTTRALFNKNPRPYEGTRTQLISLWNNEKEILKETSLRKMPIEFAKTASGSARIISFSPSEERVLYEATDEAELVRVIEPPFRDTGEVEDVRRLEPGSLYVYNAKEDKNYKLGETGSFLNKEELDSLAKGKESVSVKKPAPVPTTTQNYFNISSVQWLGSSHFVLLEERGDGQDGKRISVMEYTGENRITVYSGPFEDAYVFPHPWGNQIVIMTSLNPAASPGLNLHTLNLR